MRGHLLLASLLALSLFLVYNANATWITRSQLTPEDGDHDEIFPEVLVQWDNGDIKVKQKRVKRKVNRANVEQSTSRWVDTDTLKNQVAQQAKAAPQPTIQSSENEEEEVVQETTETVQQAAPQQTVQPVQQVQQVQQPAEQPIVQVVAQQPAKPQRTLAKIVQSAPAQQTVAPAAQAAAPTQQVATEQPQEEEVETSDQSEEEVTSEGEDEVFLALREVKKQ